MRTSKWVDRAGALFLTFPSSGSCIIKRSESMPVFNSRGGKSQATKGTLSWAPDMRTSLHGLRMKSTCVTSPSNERFVYYQLS
jgi:hypothetical protein